VSPKISVVKFVGQGPSDPYKSKTVELQDSWTTVRCIRCGEAVCSCAYMCSGTAITCSAALSILTSIPNP